MEVQIKKTVRAGNSSAVILPRAWLNKEVRVELAEKTPDTILTDVIALIRKYVELNEIIGIYLVGSYARNEQSGESDIDILIITKDTDKEIIHEGIYSILIVSSGLLKQKLEKDLLPIGQMIKEARPLLNSAYIDSIEVRATKSNIKWYLDTTKDKLKIIKKVIENAKKNNKWHVSDIVAYTLILRIRTLDIIKKLIENKEYSKKDFLNKIRNIYPGIAYERYLAVKNNLEVKEVISLEEAEKLYNYLNKDLIDVKNRF